MRPNIESTSGFFDFIAAKADELVEGGFGVAHAAVRAARDGVERFRRDFDVLFLRDFRQLLHDERGRDAAQVETLAARENRGQNFFRVRRREHEFHVLRRFFQRLQQRVEGGGGEHVHFVDDVDFEFRGGRGVFAGFAQFADLLHAVVARAVDFQHVDASGLRRFPCTSGRCHRNPPSGRRCSSGLGKNAGDGRFAGAARAAKQIGVRDAVLLDGVGERLRDVLLADDVRETFAGDTFWR